MIEHKQRLNIHADDSVLQVLALDRAEQVDFALLESTQHDGRNGDVGRLLDVTCSIIVRAPTIQNYDLLLVGAAAPQLGNQRVLVDQFNLSVRHFH